MAYGVFSSFAARAASYMRDGEERLARVRQLRKGADELHQASFDEPVGDTLLWVQRDACREEDAFWRVALFSAPSRTAAKRCLRDGGRGLADLLRDEAIHSDAAPIPFGLRAQ